MKRILMRHWIFTGLTPLLILGACSSRNNDTQAAPADQSKQVKPSDVAGGSKSDSGKSEVSSEDLTVTQNEDGTIDPESFKTALRQKYPEQAKACMEMSQSLKGSFTRWDFEVDHWTLGKSPDTLSLQQMTDKGYNPTYGVFPSEIEVSLSEDQQQLTSKLNTGSSIKNVVWDIFPNSKGKCILLQDINRTDKIMNDWIFIALDPSTDGSKTLKASFQWGDPEGTYRAHGEVNLERE